MENIKIFAFLIAVSLAACASKLPDFYFSTRGVVRVRASALDVEIARHELQKVTSSMVQGGMNGGALLEGMVCSVEVDTEGNKKIVFEIEKINFGLLDLSTKVIEIVTPPLEYGGIDFRVGTRYRVYAVKLEGRYQTWSLTGTAEL